jgi:hypothetical protein
MINNEYHNHILNTLQYKKIFTQPLSLHQLIHFGHGSFSDRDLLEKSLQELINNKKIKTKDGRFYLNSSRIKNYQKRLSRSKEMFEELNLVKNIFERVPFIKFIGVSGSLASFNYDEETDDIDFFIVCSEGRLWITRLISVLIFKLLNVYVNDKNSYLKICPNIYVSSSTMSWPVERRNIYVAHEIAMLQPLVNKDNCYLKFLTVNKWVKDYLPNFDFTEIEITNHKNHATSLLDLLDSFLMKSQKKAMKNFSGFEVLEKDLIHFLKVDHSLRILDSYTKKKIS